MRPCPKGQVTVSEQILSLANPAHSGRSMHSTRGKVAVSGSHEREYCTTKRDVPQWRACSEWDEVAYETNLTMHLGSTFLGVHLDSTFMVTCEGKSKVTLGKHDLGGAVDLRVKGRGALG